MIRTGYSFISRLLLKKLAVLFIFIYSSLSLFSLEIDSIRSLDDSQFPLIHNIEWKTGGEPELELLPEVPGAGQVRQRFSGFRPEITVERLYRIPLNSDVNTREVFVTLANIFGNPETQTKYLYESFQRKKEVPLIEEAYICDHRGKKQPPLVFTPAGIPGTFQYFQYVDEINFSGVVMKVVLEITEQFFYVTSENTESLKYGIIPLLSKESIYTDNFVFIYRDTLYVYSITQLKNDVKIKKIGPYTIYPFGMFGKRMDVMANWIRGELIR